MTEHEATLWLAGLLEGEGTFGAYRQGVRGYRYGRQRVVVALHMTDRDVIDRAAALTRNDGKISLHRRSLTEATRRRERGIHEEKDSYTIRWYSQNAEDLMRRVLPYMGERRAATIRRALAQDLSHHPRPDGLSLSAARAA